jgi:hypothetical protein
MKSGRSNVYIAFFNWNCIQWFNYRKKLLRVEFGSFARWSAIINGVLNLLERFLKRKDINLILPAEPPSTIAFGFASDIFKQKIV